ncbi:hypothetical protein PC111_g14782 [Phytophthora cactorum]|uniref:Uncharacterized protein n=1 Tax=Phytophthora cactorum TaxID=29920 RepID=A0A8T1CHC9_9STRA|nr:hypothetical protein PC111_g14782 [Phytophthora cactorum]KAG2919447.1 hypothetical protein PC117_g16765 [Phytophthora cactorum]
MAVMRGPGRTQGAAWTTVAEGDDGLGGDTEREDRRRHGEGRVDAAHGPVHMGPTRWKSIPAANTDTGLVDVKEKKLKQQIHYFGIENEFGCVNKRGVVVTCCLLTHCQETTITTSQTESRVSQAD